MLTDLYSFFGIVMKFQKKIFYRSTIPNYLGNYLTYTHQGIPMILYSDFSRTLVYTSAVFFTRKSWFMGYFLLESYDSRKICVRIFTNYVYHTALCFTMYSYGLRGIITSFMNHARHSWVIIGQRRLACFLFLERKVTLFNEMFQGTMSIRSLVFYETAKENGMMFRYGK